MGRLFLSVRLLIATLFRRLSGARDHVSLIPTGNYYREDMEGPRQLHPFVYRIPSVVSVDDSLPWDVELYTGHCCSCGALLNILDFAVDYCSKCGAHVE